MNRLLVLAIVFLPLAFSQAFDFVEKGTMPFGPMGHISATVVGSKAYIIGGLPSEYGSYIASDGFYSYEPATDTWEQLANYTAPRYGICSATDGADRIWAFGGYDQRQLDEGEDYSGTYSISTDTWSFSSIPRYMYKCSAAYIPSSNKVLIVYGRAPAVMYDPETDQYVDLGSFNGDDLGAGSVFYDNKLWLSSSDTEPTKFVTVSPDGMTWTSKADNPNGLSYHDLIRIEDAMFTFGGSLTGNEQDPGTSRINMYNITSDEWTTLSAELPLPLNGVATVLVGPSVYLFGGVYYVEDTYNATDKYWVVKCVNPSACEFGCDAESGTCIIPPAAPVSEPVSEAPVGQQPVNAPGSSAPSGSKSPQSKTSSACWMSHVSYLTTVMISVALFSM